jgi:hypothetical protein
LDARFVLEELLLPAGRKPSAGDRACHIILRSEPAQIDAASEWRLSLPVYSAFVASSCVLSFTLLGERLLQLNWNTACSKLQALSCDGPTGQNPVGTNGFEIAEQDKTTSHPRNARLHAKVDKIAPSQKG